MSEYQYYEFRAIDRPLTKKQMSKLRELSTRADITETSFVNEYHWGDFRGDPVAMMWKYFDAFLYYANWGTHQLSLRVPKRAVHLKLIRAYAIGESLVISSKGEHVLIEFHSEDESGDWEEYPSMDSLLRLRDDILGGDLRALYLAWLAGVQFLGADHEDAESFEPPVPAGLKKIHPTADERSRIRATTKSPHDPRTP